MPSGRKRTTGSRPSRSFTGSSAASRRRCWRFRMSTGPSWSTTSSSRPLTPGPRGSRGSAIAIGRERRGSSIGPWTGKKASRSPCPRATSPSRSPRRRSFRPATGGLDRVLGDDSIPIAVFKIQSGKDEPITHMALANLPMVPNVIPPAGRVRESPAASAGVDPLHGDPDARPQDQRPLRPDRGPGRSRRRALLPRLRPGQGRQGRAPRRRAAGQGQADRRLRRQRQHADDDHVSGRPVPAVGDREVDLRADRAAQGPDGQRHRGLPGRDDRRRPDQGDLAQPLGRPRPARRRGRSGSATRSTRSSTTSIASRWASSSSSTTSTRASSPAPSRRPTSRARSA